MAKYPPRGFEVWESRDQDGNYVFDPFEELAGPFYSNSEGVAGFLATEKHANGHGTIVHGGCITTLADMSLFVGTLQELPEMQGVTVNLNINFTSSALVGQWIEARARVVHKTNRMVFLQGEVTAETKVVASFSGVVRILKSSL